MMKTLFIITFISLFNILAYAQKSQYFLIRKDSSEIVPKDLFLPEVTDPSDSRFTQKENQKQLMDSCILFFNEVFDRVELTAEDIKGFHHTTFSVTFEKEGKVIYYRYIIIGSGHTKNLLKWEKQLYEFAQKMASINFKPYVEIHNEPLFKYGTLSIGRLDRKFKNRNSANLNTK